MALGASVSAAGTRCSSARNQNGVPGMRRHLRTASAGRLQPGRAAATDADAANGSLQPVRPDTSAAALLNAFEGLDSGGSKQLRDFCEFAYLSGRSRVVQDHFPMALGKRRCWCRFKGCSPACSFGVAASLARCVFAARLKARPVLPYAPPPTGVDDFLHRMEIALFAYGFNGDNSIGAPPVYRGRPTGGRRKRGGTLPAAPAVPARWDGWQLPPLPLSGTHFSPAAHLQPW